MRPQKTLVAVLLLAVLAGCESTANSLQQMSRTEVYFGRSRPGGPNVSDDEFRRFAESEIATRFPRGFTLLPAEGHWREAGGRIVTEPSMLLILFTDSRSAADAESIEEICHAYRTQFGQEAVLKVTSRVEVEFETASTNALMPTSKPSR
jgi:hypothetical protein